MTLEPRSILVRLVDVRNSMVSENFGHRNRPASRWGKRLFGALLVLYPMALLVLSLVNALDPKRAGLLALSEVFAPYLFLPLVLIAPFALLRGAGLLRVMLLICVVVFCVRFPPRLVAAAPQATPGAIHLSAMQWNVLA